MKFLKTVAEPCRPVILQGPRRLRSLHGLPARAALGLLLALPLLTLLLPLRPAAAAPLHGVVLLVRHAERASTAADSRLSAAGQRRAACLADTLRDAGVGTIFTTEVGRTQQTAMPLAHRVRRSLRIVPKSATADLVRLVESAAAAGGVVLVVGHADTLPAIVHGLSAAAIPPYGDDEYDRLVVLPMSSGVAGPPVVLRYCDEPAAP